ncbi:alpha/beta fold hydrolase [Gordonia sp. (in: high G+C Gram-positive bacteria)]|uniref:alpha/beta fold hydrolase n=1 Tax=Gordonia sp. (in: high G+C Gram-positive bacteria) TaxID=84139 RepID=UPI003F9A7B32
MNIEFVPDQNLYPFASRWFESSRARVHYVDEGTGTPILFCHGSPTWSFLYRKVIGDLSSRYRCIAVDYPGFGLSERPPGYGYTIDELTDAVGELIDHLHLEGFIVVGQDWGGPIGLGAALRRADRVRGVVVSNTAFWPIEPLANRAFSVIMSSAPMQRKILQQNFLVEKFLLGKAGPALTPEEADQYRAVQPDWDARRGLAVMPAQIRAARPLLAKLSTDVPTTLGAKPALAVWGMRDMVFRPNTCLPRVRDSFADLTVVELPEAGHFVPEDAPYALARAIVDRFPC